MLSAADFDFKPLTPSTWRDFEALFTSGIPTLNTCWCVFWRKTRSAWSRDAGDGNRRQFKALVDEGHDVGILAYREGVPVGWCAVGPRADCSSLDRSPTLKPIDDAPAWSITCFAVSKDYRGSGMTGILVAQAARYARSRGATVLEAYPYCQDAEGKERTPVEAYMGFSTTFERLGFRQVSDRSKVRNIWRLDL